MLAYNCKRYNYNKMLYYGYTVVIHVDVFRSRKGLFLRDAYERSYLFCKILQQR